MTVMVNGERLTRSVRRVYRLEDGSGYIGWCSIAGKDTKVFKAKHCRNWTLAA
jgi:hypothetical protein